MKYKKKPIVYDGYEVSNIFDIPSMTDIDKNYLQSFVLSGESIEEVSYILYGNSEYYWVIMLLNGIVNPSTDWYMSSTTLREYCKIKYSDPNDVHHFYNINTKNKLNTKSTSDMQYLLDNNMKLPYNISFVTNYEYEVSVNESKKVIETVTKNKILEFINIYNDRMNRM